MREFHHDAVLTDEVVLALAPERGGWFCDLTVGGAGHARALLDGGSDDLRLLGIDRDPRAVEEARSRLAPYGARARVEHARFSAWGSVIDAASFGHQGEIHREVDGVLVDLGVSSHQLDTAERGFAFSSDGPLDMRMGREGRTAAALIDELDDGDLAACLRAYGDVPLPGRIARAIKRARERGEMKTTSDLRALCETFRYATGARRHSPATLVFQALRIAVNEELDELKTLLDSLPGRLATGGVAAIISFHSLEDRLVKRAFAALTTPPPMPRGLPIRGDGPMPDFAVVTKGRSASADESERNPRARSARLRAIKRVTPASTTPPASNPPAR